MAIQHPPSEELRAAVTELDRCLYNHEQWLEGLFGALICRLPPDERDLDVDAHRKCRLGQWYYSGSAATASLIKRPGFAELGTEHERMHCYAAKMLRTSMAGEQISLENFQRFMNAQKRMHLEISTLRQEIEDMLYALDPLTGIPGRVGLLTRLREQLGLVKRGVQSCCLAMMDLDGFKSVNDRFGHGVGDEVLNSYAHHLTQGLRPYDKVFRYGGEEFLIMLPDTTLEEGTAIIERLREGLALLPHDATPGDPLYVTASFGIVPLDADVSVETSIERADKALYAAKAAGRNRSAIWDSSMAANEPHSLHDSAA